MGVDLLFNPPPEPDLPTQVAALVRQRDSLIAEIDRYRKEIATLRADNAALKRTLNLYQADVKATEQ